MCVSAAHLLGTIIKAVDDRAARPEGADGDTEGCFESHNAKVCCRIEDGNGKCLVQECVVLVSGLDPYAEGGVGFVVEGRRGPDGAVGLEGEK